MTKKKETVIQLSHTHSKSQAIPKILVIGGGIAGIQSSLDLANSGFRVYILEKKSAIGGVMAQLDKTFPTNDCSMCILSPKLVEAGRHPNIEVITQGEIEEVQGTNGHFEVKIRKHPRYVDIEKCKNCGDCSKACPVLLPDTFDEGLSQRNAIYQLFPQANPNAYVIDKYGEPPCRAQCPLHVNVQGYIALLRMGKYHEAYELVQKKNPFPGITGRICTRPCETVCRRGDADEPVAIDYLKRFLADNEATPLAIPHENNQTSDIKIAIIGSGPAGLLAGYDLALKGYKPTIFESSPIPGGMLAVGIPPYRLPRDILQREIGYVKKAGARIQTNTTIGKDITISELRKKGYKAIFVAVGAQENRRLYIPGEDLDGVSSALYFLKQFNLNKKITIGKKIAIIGGGDAAIDAGRTALRLAQKKYGKDTQVWLIYRRSREEMPAQKNEIEEAEKEGLRIHTLASPVKIHGGNGKVTSLECQRMRLGKIDESGRRKPIPIPNSYFSLNVDMVLVAIGQKPNLSFFPHDDSPKISKWETLEVDPVTLETDIPGIFAGGDAVTGPRTYIEAMAAGRKAAISIDRYMQGKDLHADRGKEGIQDDYVKIDITNVTPHPRKKMPLLPIESRRESFDEVEVGFSEDMALGEANRCLNCGGCSECMECIKACEPEAIFHEMDDTVITFHVGSIIAALGFDEFDPCIKKEYGYGRFPNVISSIEFERIMSTSGPYQGHIKRPFDEKEPKKIAWIQCVGSRDPHINHGYCSSICCMASVKEAVIAKEHSPSIDPTIFYMDLRAFGKNFERYIDRAENDYDIRFIRSRISHIKEDSATHDLIIKYEIDDGHLQNEVFNLVVLAVGLEPPRDIEKLARILGIELNHYGFVSHPPFYSYKTNREGIFVAGALAGPKDIPETVAQASAVASAASQALVSSRGKDIIKKEYPPELSISGLSPRIGVFICHCGSNIGGYIDIKKIVEYAQHLPHVAHAEENLYTCSQDSQNHIREMIEKHSLNRVVVASCTPRTHEPLFQETIREAGLNPHLFEMANIRDQCSWVHMEKPQEATQKAKDLVRMAVEKSSLLTPLPTITLEINPRCLIIGGGITGLSASLALADQGFEVYLVEKEEMLGGNLNTLRSTLEGYDIPVFLKSIIKRVQEHQNITIYTKSQIIHVEGYIGQYTTQISQGKERIDLHHGVFIVCTGSIEHQPTEYLYGKDQRVMTQRELENHIALEKINIKPGMNIVMIQCVGSRDQKHPYCSRICCSMAVKNALKIKELNKAANVYVLFRDMRTYGFKEDYYQKAREKGIIFIHFNQDKKPQVCTDKGILRVSVYDSILDDIISIRTDILALSSGIEPNPLNSHLSKLLKVPLTTDGFLQEAHAKLKPVDFSTDGIFLAGFAHSPQFVDECISQAHAAVSRSLTILTKRYIEIPGLIARVNPEKCSGCGLCTEVCSYGAIELINLGREKEEKIVASVNEPLCKGCGICAGACLSGAIQLFGFTDKQMLSMIKALANN